MGWEKRERGGRYYTRSRKVNGRVVREYVGAGALAESAAAMDAEERAQRKARAAARQQEQTRLDAIDAMVTELCDLTDALTHGVLLLAGYHQHHRGEWRRKRD